MYNKIGDKNMTKEKIEELLKKYNPCSQQYLMLMAIKNILEEKEESKKWVKNIIKYIKLILIGIV